MDKQVQVARHKDQGKQGLGLARDAAARARLPDLHQQDHNRQQVRQIAT